MAKTLLIDTHAFLWWNNEPHRLSFAAQTALAAPNNTLILSLASVWEMQIKISLGQMTVVPTLRNVVERNQQVNGVRLLAVTEEHIFALASLPHLHKDPFDRILIAQATVEGATLLTVDTIIPTYGVPTLW